MSYELLLLSSMLAFASGVGIVLMFIIRQLRELHLSMNSRLDELLKTTGTLARAEGFKAGQDDHLEALKAAGRNLEK